MKTETNLLVNVTSRPPDHTPAGPGPVTNRALGAVPKEQLGGFPFGQFDVGVGLPQLVEFCAGVLAQVPRALGARMVRRLQVSVGGGVGHRAGGSVTVVTCKMSKSEV
jgi:hypothetical protein